MRKRFEATYWHLVVLTLCFCFCCSKWLILALKPNVFYFVCVCLMTLKVVHADLILPWNLNVKHLLNGWFMQSQMLMTFNWCCLLTGFWKSFFELHLVSTQCTFFICVTQEAARVYLTHKLISVFILCVCVCGRCCLCFPSVVWSCRKGLSV